MLQRFGTFVHTWFVASHRNEYHPHLLAERGMTAIFALILGAEAFLIANTISLQSGTPSLAAVGSFGMTGTETLPPIISGLTEAWLQYAIAPLVALAAHPAAGSFALMALACMVALLMGVLAHTLAARQYAFQPIGYLSGGTMLLFAIVLLLYNNDVLLPQAEQNRQAAATVLASDVESEVEHSQAQQSWSTASTTVSLWSVSTTSVENERLPQHRARVQ